MAIVDRAFAGDTAAGWRRADLPRAGWRFEAAGLVSTWTIGHGESAFAQKRIRTG